MDVGTPRVTSHLKQETYSRERRRHSDPLRLQSLGQRTPVRRAGKNQRTPIYGAGSKQFPVDPRNRTPHPVAEWLWLKRWQGNSPRSTLANPDASLATWDTLSPGGKPTVKELSTVRMLKSFADSIDKERQEFLDGIDENRLHANLQYTDMAGKPFVLPLVQLMQHVVNHGTYHRGQVTTMLRQVGAEAASLDMLFFFREGA